MTKTRIEYAVKYFEDSKFLFEKKKYNSAISRLYYASYQAMWAALDNPKEGYVWKHLAIIKPFVHGYWFNPEHPEQSQGLLEHFRLPLRQLYTYRIKADYDLIDINEHIVDNMITAVNNVIKTVTAKKGM